METGDVEAFLLRSALPPNPESLWRTMFVGDPPPAGIALQTSEERDGTVEVGQCCGWAEGTGQPRGLGD